jgi:hypothetical protein
MRLYFSSRDRKTVLISNLINSILLSVIGLYYLQPENFIIFVIFTFIGSFIFQYHVLILPTIISNGFMNPSSAKNKINELRQKIKEIESEIEELDYKKP